MQASAEQKRKIEHPRKGERTLDRVERAYKLADLSPYPLKKRLVIRAAGITFYLLTSLIGLTAHFEVEGWEHWEAASRDPFIPIYTSWHNRLILATYFFRHRRIIVMSSRSFDAEYAARFILRFGFGVAKGSSTRGGVGGIIEMIRLMRAGCPAGFMIDGPKGPRYVAKMGAVLLAKKTGNPILPFTITPARFWEVKSWDAFQVPKPFTRALTSIAPPIFVPADADEETLNARHAELQQTLDKLTRRGEEWRASQT
jgi:lysophospholipid acyltransferase (LPLAT)-like uncharacterized protein